MIKLVLLTLATATFAFGSAAGIKGSQRTYEECDAKIIVELSSSQGRSEKDILNEQNSLLSVIKTTITPNFVVNERLTSISNILIMDVPAKYVDDIRGLKQVKDVDYDVLRSVKYDDNAITIRKSGSTHDVEKDNASAETMNMPSNTKEGEGVLVAILDNSFKLDHEAFSPLSADVAQKLEASDVKNAKGLHAIVNNEHTCYHNSKVPFYYDYGGTAIGRDAEPVSDWDVFEKTEEHGSHVASITAANGPYKGIAPKAQLALMKVFTDYIPTAEEAKEGYTQSSGALDSKILLGIEDAVKLDADIISLSLGSNLDDFDKGSITYRVIEDAVKNGYFINFAAGNNGKQAYARTGYEYFTTDMVETGNLGSYANFEAPMVIAANQLDWEFYETALLVDNKNVSYSDQVMNYTTADGDVKYKPERPLSDLTENGQSDFDWIRIPGWGEADDYKDIDVKGKIAVVFRGETTFTSKVENAATRGAIAVIIINNDPSETDFTFRMDFAGYQPTLPVVSVLFRDKEIFDNAQQGVLSVLVNKPADNPTAKQIAAFSTDGATYDLDLKPDISAPGQNIKGAVNASNSSYEYFSGTSMSTPNYSGALAVLLSEHLDDEDYKDTLNARTMSTTKLLVDKYGTNHASVRVQGAGMIDIKKALDSKVFLDGMDVDGSPLGKAKITLKNNDDIKNGNIKLSFFTNSEETSSVTYSATTYVYRPNIAQYREESYPELVGDFQTTDNFLIKTATQDVVVEPGVNKVTLSDLSLNDQEKKDIDKYFENGCFIEGYVVLTAEGKESISIPYLGFYGDYGAQFPVEPFTFEKEEGKTYASDLVNSVSHALGIDSVDFSSSWVSGYWDSLEDISLDSWILNETTLFDIKDSNRKKVIAAGTDPYSGEVNKNSLNFANNSIANTMIISQFVNRSVKTNNITLTHKASNNVVLRDHMFDSLYGDEGNWSLFKSHVDDGFLENKIVAHRAYTIIPLFNEKTKVNYPDGEYSIEFSYELMATGETVSKTYDIVIDSSSPSLTKIENVNVGNEAYLRFRYEKTNMSYAAINGARYQVLKDEQGCYVDVKKSDYSKNNQFAYLKSYNLCYGETATLTDVLDDTYFMTLSDASLVMSHKFTTEVEEVASGDRLSLAFTLSVKKGNKKATFDNGLTVTMKFDGKLSEEELAVYTVDGDKENRVNDVKIHDGFITFDVTSSLSFKVVGKKVGSSTPDTPASPKGCGGSIIASSILVSAISLSLLAFLIIKKKKVLVK